MSLGVQGHQPGRERVTAQQTGDYGESRPPARPESE